MDINYSASIIIPTYNEQETIEECLSNIIEESKKFDSMLTLDNMNTNYLNVFKN